MRPPRMFEPLGNSVETRMFRQQCASERLRCAVPALRRTVGSSMKVLVTSNHSLLGNSLVAMLEHSHAPHGEHIEVSLSDPASVASRLQEFLVDIVVVEAFSRL